MAAPHPAEVYGADNAGMPEGFLDDSLTLAAITDRGISVDGAWTSREEPTHVEILRVTRDDGGEYRLAWQIVSSAGITETLRRATYREGVLVTDGQRIQIIASGFSGLQSSRTVASEPPVRLHAVRIDGHELLLPERSVGGLTRRKLARVGTAYWRR